MCAGPTLLISVHSEINRINHLINSEELSRELCGRRDHAKTPMLCILPHVAKQVIEVIKAPTAKDQTALKWSASDNTELLSLHRARLIFSFQFLLGKVRD